MLTNLLLLTAAYGLYFLVAQSTLLEAPRVRIKNRSTFAAKLLSCPFCTGFWCALLVWLFRAGADGVWMSRDEVFGWPIFGFAGATFVYALETAIVRMER